MSDKKKYAFRRDGTKFIPGEIANINDTIPELPPAVYTVTIDEDTGRPVYTYKDDCYKTPDILLGNVMEPVDFIASQYDPKGPSFAVSIQSGNRQGKSTAIQLIANRSMGDNIPVIEVNPSRLEVGDISIVMNNLSGGIIVIDDLEASVYAHTQDLTHNTEGIFYNELIREIKNVIKPGFMLLFATKTNGIGTDIQLPAKYVIQVIANVTVEQVKAWTDHYELGEIKVCILQHIVPLLVRRIGYDAFSGVCDFIATHTMIDIVDNARYLSDVFRYVKDVSRSPGRITSATLDEDEFADMCAVGRIKIIDPDQFTVEINITLYHPGPGNPIADKTYTLKLFHDETIYDDDGNVAVVNGFATDEHIESLRVCINKLEITLPVDLIHFLVGNDRAFSVRPTPKNPNTNLMHEPDSNEQEDNNYNGYSLPVPESEPDEQWVARDEGRHYGRPVRRTIGVEDSSCKIARGTTAQRIVGDDPWQS